ncbi:hypothetical protein HQ865_08190 [Mucilaginibacter mali]|uniref:Uncharacterized protein n=1 Tax=Mucilaginibacter mali TaxID=2740462 RepID=A0A7D4UA92_9SPHI|nr:DUF6263 family protein [Mucilaginibacter mali]QKJ29738.1 hypothetical protein HQ865_08190 [Mucilaginibacter mali]
MKKSFGILLLIIASVNCHAQYVKLALNLVKGNTYYNLTTATATVVQTVNGQKTQQGTTITSRIAFKVMNIRDSLYEMEMRYENLSLKMDLPQGTIQYNSNGIDATSKVLAALRNQPIAVVITRNGNLQALAPISTAIDRAIKQFPQLSAEERAQIKSMMEQSFGERAFRSNFEMGTVIFPSVPVRKNAFWISDTQLESSRPANVHSIAELRDITPTFNQIHVNSTITYLNRDEFIVTNGIPLKYNMEGSRSADIVVDTVTGWVKQASILQNIGGTTEIKDNPTVPGGMVIPTVMKSEVVITDVH